MKKIIYCMAILIGAQLIASDPRRDLARLHQSLTELADAAAARAGTTDLSALSVPISVVSEPVSQAAMLIERNYRAVVGWVKYSLVSRGDYSFLAPENNAAFLTDVQTLIALLKAMPSDQRVEALGYDYTALDWLRSIYESQVGDGGRWGFDKVLKIFARQDLNPYILAGKIAADLQDYFGLSVVQE